MINLKQYQEFVTSTTSKESRFYTDFDTSLRKNHVWDAAAYEEAGGDTDLGFVAPLLITAGIGLSSETGEFNELIKKVIFQGKPYDEKVRFHMKRELGDIMWYLANACTALGYDLEEIVEENINKLEARYPNGFEVFRSENRAEGDL